jgi:hypothetical protein
MARFSLRWWFPAAAFLLAAAPPAFADPAKVAVSVQALPGGVADVAGETGYVTNNDRNIVAVNLANGKQLWAGARGDYPVAVVGDKVFVLDADAKKFNVLRMTACEGMIGKTLVQSDPVTFPDWVDLRPDSGQSFGLLPRVDQGDLWLRWRARAGKPGDKGAREATGAVRINIASGKVEMLDADKMPPPPPPALALSKALTKLAERPYETPAGPEMNVLTAGGYAVAVEVERDGAKQKVVLRRWDATTEKEQDPVTLATGAPFQVILSPVPGAASIRPAPDPKRPADAGRWRVYSLETGKLKASFPVEPGTLDAAVVGGRFIYTYHGSPPPEFRPQPGDRSLVVTLNAIDLDTAKMAWRMPLDPQNPFWGFLYVTTPPGDSSNPCSGGGPEP